MEADAILSFRAPSSDTGRVEVFASPVLELVYATFFLTAPRRRTIALDWLDAVEEGTGPLIAELRAIWPEAEGKVGLELFFMACKFGYARDESPGRFLHDLPSLADEVLAFLGEQSEFKGMRPETLAMLKTRLTALRERQVATRYQALLKALWGRLEPLWHAEGQRAVLAERERFLSELKRSDILSALPRHYFARSETFEQDLRRFSSEGRVLVSPLYFSAGGGFAIDFDDTFYIGYGLRTETVYQQLAKRAEQVAMQMKAFADPTRLLLLSLIGRYQMTVSDLAAQLEVSQPTVSGHLKVLREAKLVTVKKQGNKAFYQVDSEAIKRTLEAADELVQTLAK
jgi:DNA-binding transcriptional ArsR family regulator